MQTNARIGVLLAAGRGRRMGRTKQLLPWSTGAGREPLVAAAFDAVADVCDAIIVVVGHEADAVTTALGKRTFHAVASDPDADMFASVRAGMEAATRLDSAADVLLQPADHPAVQHATLDALIRAARDHATQAIMPEYRGQGGHPVLIPAALLAEILAYDGRGGLRRFWELNVDRCLRHAVRDASVVLDLDTPGDYEAALEPAC